MLHCMKGTHPPTHPPTHSGSLDETSIMSDSNAVLGTCIGSRSTAKLHYGNGEFISSTQSSSEDPVSQ